MGTVIPFRKRTESAPTEKELMRRDTMFALERAYAYRKHKYFFLMAPETTLSDSGDKIEFFKSIIGNTRWEYFSILSQDQLKDANILALSELKHQQFLYKLRRSEFIFITGMLAFLTLAVTFIILSKG